MPDQVPAAGDVRTHPDDTGSAPLLAALHQARRRGDAAAARRAWQTIVAAELERVRGIVRGYRHEALPGSRIPHAEQDDVVMGVFERLHDKSDALQGRSVGELRNFMRTAAGFVCADYVRAHVRDDRRRAGSLDSGAAEGFGASPETDRALAQLAAQLNEDSGHADVHRAMVHEAMEDVSDDKRAVLAMTVVGFTVDEIAERLGISRDSVYQRRRRGLIQLGRAIRERAEEDDEA